MSFTDAWLRATNGKPYKGKAEITYRNGVGVRVSPKGKITWIYRALVNGKPIKMKIGEYPGMKISGAMGAAEKLIEDTKRGVDPRAGIQSKKSPVTINYVIDYWLENHAKRNVKQWPALEKMFRTDISKTLGNCLVSELELVDYLNAFAQARKRVSEKHAANLMARFKTVLSYAVRHSLIKFNPIAELIKTDVGKPVTAKKSKQSINAVRPLWEGISQIHIHESNKNFLRLMMIFANRANELRLAKKSDFDLNEMIWTVPEAHNKTRKKNGGEIKRAIPPLALEVIKNQLMLYPNFKIMFPAVAIDEDRPMSANTPGNFGEKLADYIQSKGYPRTTNHDMRRTARNIWEQIGIPYHVSETMLGHKVHTGVQAHYLDYAYIDEQREAYAKWCDIILTGSPVQA
ncbi:integrase [Vibrio sp. HA2012]|uniref:tyrosine-type recombinase/integrase n=1 Tax=Vibrio sp. HA2012 TaxID=1971595 RepID=UPI000C2C4644|nr:site-specific integrase [Vibrio sp. HA2012]PJC87792.1 integrase [Vibrio sp. HA2012]